MHAKNRRKDRNRIAIAKYYALARAQKQLDGSTTHEQHGTSILRALPHKDREPSPADSTMLLTKEGGGHNVLVHVFLVQQRGDETVARAAAQRNQCEATQKRVVTVHRLLRCVDRSATQARGV